MLHILRYVLSSRFNDFKYIFLLVGESPGLAAGGEGGSLRMAHSRFHGVAVCGVLRI